MPVELKSIEKSNKSNKKNYPVFEGARSVVNQIVQKHAKIKALEDEIKPLKEEVAKAVFPTAVHHIKEGGEELGVSAVGDIGSVLVVYKNDFRTGADREEVEGVIGDKLASKCFRQRFKLTVDGDVLVAKLGVQKTNKLVAKLVEVFEDFEVSDALASKEDYVPKDVQHLFETLSVEQLTSLSEVVKIPSSVSVK